MVLHYSALEKIPHFDEIIYYSIIQSYVMTDPLCHDLSIIHKLMLALLPSQKLDIATLGSILDSQPSWESSKIYLARWSHEVVLLSPY